MVDEPNLDRGVVIWLTGLPAAGKSTLAMLLVNLLRAKRKRVELLEGEAVRAQFSPTLGFLAEDRNAHVARIATMADLLARKGVFVVVATVSPFREARDRARHAIGAFVEVYVATPLGECVRRDPKGLYRRALAGDIPLFTGLNDPYEPPLAPEVVVDTSRGSPDDSARRVMEVLVECGYL